MLGRIFWCFTVSAALVVTPGRANTSDAIDLAPSSAWQLEYADDRCRLSRVFGEGEWKTIFWIEQSAPSDSFQWMVAGGAINHLGSTGGVSALYGPGFEVFDTAEGSPSSVALPKLRLKEYGAVLRAHGFRHAGPRSDQAPVSQGTEPWKGIGLNPVDGSRIEYLSLMRKGREARLQTENLQSVFEALNTCTSDLFRSWGFEPGLGSAVVEGAKAKNLRSIAHRLAKDRARFSSSDTMVDVKMLVGTNGRVEKCVHVKKVQGEELGRRACELIELYALFEPALDANGNPTQDLFSTSVVLWTN